MQVQIVKIDGKEYSVRSEDWDGEVLKEAASQLEQGILFYKKTKDEISAVVLAALAFAYDSVSKSKAQNEISPKELSPQNTDETQAALEKILQKISIHIQSPNEEAQKKE